MIASLAGAIAIVTHGNRYLRGGLPEPPDMAQISAFKFVRSLRFYPRDERVVRWWNKISGLKPTTEIRSIEGSAHWLRALRERGAVRLWLGGSVITRKILPAHIAVAFAGTTGWTISPEMNARNTMWVNTERLLRQVDYKNPNDDKKIWESSFYEVDATPIPRTTNVEAARTALNEALDAAIAFCGRARNNWADWLVEAQLQLSSDQPKAPYHSDMFPVDATPLRTRQLGNAASSAWVFRGMGSWNDQLFENELQAEFDQVSQQLYDAVLNGLVQSANNLN